MQVQPSVELAYWVGIVQSDASLERYQEKTREKLKYRISLTVAKKSLPMLLKFRNLSMMLLNRNSNVWKQSKREIWGMHIGVKNLLEIFDDLDIKFGDPPVPSIWIANSKKFFGAYLAGLIDGDGCVTIKRKKYPQCLIRITGGHEQTKLAKIIEINLKCATYFSHRIAVKFLNNKDTKCNWFELGFLVSSKNYKFIYKHILPNLALQYKKERLQSFILERFVLGS